LQSSTRGPDELKGPLGHIAGVLNVPLPELPQRPDELAQLKDTPLVVVCQTDKRSARVVALLDAAGFCDVRVLRGGMVRWNEAGLPVAGRPGSDQS
jgi:rhodanese-related sulfurtransferase